jgi:vancomycin permeability regulator SanA
MFIIWKIFKRAIALLLALVIAIPAYTAYRIWSVGTNAKPVPSDVIVVLGAAEYNGTASAVLAARLAQAKLIYQEGYGKRIITVGSNQKGDLFTEAQVARNWLISNSLNKNKISAIPIGQDTLSSTKAYVAQMLANHEKSVVIVTDKFHCDRALTMARDLGVSATCSPAQTGPAGSKINSPKYLMREVFAYLSYLTVGRLGVNLSDQVKQVATNS